VASRSSRSSAHAPPDLAPPARVIPLPWSPDFRHRPRLPRSEPSSCRSAAARVSRKALRERFRIGYPHSTVGAVSASVSTMRQIGSTLDADRAAPRGTPLADSRGLTLPSSRSGPAPRASTRTPAPAKCRANASVVLSPVEYQVQSATADDAKVLLLATYTTSSRARASRPAWGSTPGDEVVRRDWHILSHQNTDYSGLSAQPNP